MPLAPAYRVSAGLRQVAQVLRTAGTQVRLIVARPVEPSNPDIQVDVSTRSAIPGVLFGACVVCGDVCFSAPVAICRICADISVGGDDPLSCRALLQSKPVLRRL